MGFVIGLAVGMVVLAMLLWHARSEQHVIIDPTIVFLNLAGTACATIAAEDRALIGELFSKPSPSASAAQNQAEDAPIVEPRAAQSLNPYAR
jgi:hypothetical protein